MPASSPKGLADLPVGRQRHGRRETENRRVEIVVSGEVIGRRSARECQILSCSVRNPIRNVVSTRSRHRPSLPDLCFI